ncbi:MAG TPA: prolyl oligopeptidase family serine peptidase, partial [Candidatus Eisenbacteria bacterium]
MPIPSVSSLSRRGVFLSALVGLALLPAAVRAADKAEVVPFSPGPYIPDIATFLNIGACSPAGYSWDGKTVYFTASMSGAGQVYRITDQGWPYQLTTFEDGIEGFNLSWNGAMAIVSASVGGDENAQLYLLDTDTGRIEPLTQQPKVQFGSVTWIPDDSGIYYRSNEENGKDFFIYRMDFPSRKVTKVYDKTEGYNSVAELSLDNTIMIVSNSTSNVNNDLYVLDLKSGQSRQLTKDTGDVSYESVNLMPDKKTIWLTSNGNPDGISKLGTMSIDSPEISWVNDGWLDPKWEVEGVSFSRDYKTMAVRQNEDGYGRLKMREVSSKKPLPNPPLDGILGSVLFDKDGACILSFSGPTRAPDVWKWNPRTKELKQLTYTIYAGIDRNLFKDPQLVRYPTFDGRMIPAFMYLPPNYKPGTPVPFVVDAHGGPESQFRPDFIRNFQYLMLIGYGVLAPNVRGSSGYGIEDLNLDNYKNRKDSLKDYKAGVDWLVKEGYTKPGMIGIRGGSYG